MVLLEPTPITYLAFITLAIMVGMMAGILPAYFFSKVKTASVLKDASSVRLFKNLNFRKTLIVFQFTLSLSFIVAVSLANRQYQFAIAYDLGLTTENILNVDLQGNKAEVAAQAFSEVPEVKQIARSIFVPATGTQWSGYVRYNQPEDSTNLYYNYVDEKYLSLHEIPLLAGENFIAITSDDMNDAGVIINEQMLKWMELEKPEDAIGEEIKIDGKPTRVIGVVKDFHYSRLNSPIRCFAFRYYGNLAPDWGGVLNLKVQSNDLKAMMEKLEGTWKKFDKVHPFYAKFYDDKIRESYDQLSGIVHVIGFMAFLAISIASLGLLGMVVFTTETRIKEISIRKVLGATISNLLYMMSKGFIFLLLISAIIAIPCTFLLFDRVIFGSTAYRAPFGFTDLFGGALIVFAIAILAIGSQTLKVAKTNPATVLKND
jgi:ABC-type antimicrobial peptide transport system permease subunit